jgi:superfamily II DNA or RNA helicase
VELRIGPVNTTVSDIDGETFDWLDTLLSVSVQHARYTAAFNSGAWDGRRHFLNKRRWFPTGLVPWVLDACAGKGLAVRLDDRRRAPLPGPRSLWLTPVALQEYLTARGIPDDGGVLRRVLYQRRAVRELWEHTVGGLPWPRGVMEMATGSGKTVAAAVAILRYDLPTLYLVPNKTLLAQTQRVLARVLERPVGLLGAGKREFEEVTVATVQTASRLSKSREFRKYLETVPMVVGDEVHLLGGRGMWVDVVQRTPAYVKVGFTGTAFRRRDVGDVNLVAAFGDVLYKLPSLDLMRAGLLASVQIYLMAVTEPRGLAWASWERAFNVGVVDNEDLNRTAATAVKRMLDAGRPVLVLVRYLRQGHQFRDLLRYQLRVPSVYIDGKTPLAERRQVAERLAKGEVLAVISTPAFDEGVDLPNLRGVVLLSGGKSETKAIQRIGRGLRRKAGSDNTLVVLDFLPRTNRYLYEHAKQRYAIYQSEGWPVQLIDGLESFVC